MVYRQYHVLSYGLQAMLCILSYGLQAEKKISGKNSSFKNNKRFPKYIFSLQTGLNFHFNY